MEDRFITQKIVNHGIEVLTPNNEQAIGELHRIIQKELTYGNIIPSSKDYVISIIKSLVDKGANGVVLGCTEFPLIINASDFNIPVFNTTEIHAQAGVKFILDL